MLDLDAMFEKYLREWLAEHAHEYEPDSLDEMVPELYEKWATSPAEELGGTTPRGYFAAISDPEELVKMFVSAHECGTEPCALLIDRMKEVEGCDKGLCAIAERDDDPELVAEAMNVLGEMGAEQPLDKYAERVTSGSDETLAELAAEMLGGHVTPAVREKLLSAVKDAPIGRKEMIADILCEAGRDERVYELLKELFLSGHNVPFAAALLGKYGDERAAEFLYPALDECNYLEFIEIRNAIEQMGGVVDDDYRDFSDDEYYKAIKHLK